MKLYTFQNDKATVFDLDGRLDAASVAIVSPVVNEAISAGNVNLVFDLSGMDYSSSAGMRLLLSTVQQVRAKGGDLKLAAVPEQVYKIFEMSGVTDILQTFSQVDAAVANF